MSPWWVGETRALSAVPPSPVPQLCPAQAQAAEVRAGGGPPALSEEPEGTHGPRISPTSSPSTPHVGRDTPGEAAALIPGARPAGHGRAMWSRRSLAIGWDSCRCLGPLASPGKAVTIPRAGGRGTVSKDPKWKKACPLTFSTTDDKSQLRTDRHTDDFVVVAREDCPGCRVVTCGRQR